MNLAAGSALVTGGAVRIGRAIALALAARGCAVVVHYSRSRAAAERLAADIRAGGGVAQLVRGDLADLAGCARLVAAAVRLAPGLNVLVNNASVFNKDPLARMTPAGLEAEFRVNLFAPMLLTQAFAAALARRRGGARRGQVINLLDRRVAVNEAGCIPYLLTKKALEAFTRSAALELAPHVAVNAVAPGAVLPPPGMGPGVVRDLAGRTPLPHPSTPEDVARAVVALLELDGVTGQTLFVDSGQHLLGSTAGAVDAPGGRRRAR